MNLYEITKQYQEAVNMVDEDWVITDEGLEIISQSELSLKDKTQNICHIINEFENKSDVIKKEIERLNNFQKTINNNNNRLRKYLQLNMENSWITKIETDLYKISFRKSEVVEIYDENNLPSEYLKTKTTITPDKTALKKALKEWLVIDGVTLVWKNNLQIK